MPITISFNQETGSISVESEKLLSSKRNKGNSLLDFPQNYTVIDIETTGLDPNFDSIIEIAAIKVVNNSIESTFSSLVKPPVIEYDEEYDDCDFLSDDDGHKYYYVDDYISKLTHITNEMLDTAPEVKDVLDNFVNFISDDILVGHNVNFDINFLYDNLLDYCDYKLTNDFIDTLRLCRRLHKELTHHRLSDMVEFYKIDTSSAAHRALSDCETTNKLFERLHDSMLEQFESLDNFKLSLKRKRKTLDVNSITTSNENFNTLHPLYRKVCCFTGKLENLQRKDAMQLVVDLGGIVANSVTKKTNYLILGNNDYCPTIKDGKSSKQKKAEKLKLSGQDIDIISENTFYEMLNYELWCYIFLYKMILSESDKMQVEKIIFNPFRKYNQK